MIFAKLDVTIYTHPKVLEAGPDAFGFWCACLAHLRQHESSDGYLAPHVIGSMLSLPKRRCFRLAEKLVRCQLFAKSESGGFVFLRYSDHNETKEEIEERRKNDRIRKNSKRNPDGLPSDSERIPIGFPSSSNGGIPSSPSVSVSSENGERDPEGSTTTERASGTVRVVRNVTDDGAFGGSVDAWTEGVRSVAPRFSRPTGGPAMQLVQCFLDQGWRPQEIVDRAREAGAAYARARRGRVFKAADYCDWEGSGRPSHPALSSPAPMKSPTHRAIPPLRKANDG